MRSLSLSDIHCDTALELFKLKEDFSKNSLSVSSRLADEFDRYIQVAAVWSDKSLECDQAYERFFEVVKYLEDSIKNDSSVTFFCGGELTSKKSLVLAVEDARLLNGDINRLTSLYSAGVRILTLLWSGVTCIGGSFNTNIGLTEFGRQVVKKCIELGIIPDISHASIESSYDIFDICDSNTPVIASHSDSYSVYPHKRNLSDEQFLKIKDSGGLVGINLYTDHLGADIEKSSIDTVMRHIEHYLEIGGKDTVCFGCDFDGANTPKELQNISSLYKLADEMTRRNYTSELINKIFYLNVENFILKYIK